MKSLFLMTAFAGLTFASQVTYATTYCEGTLFEDLHFSKKGHAVPPKKQSPKKSSLPSSSVNEESSTDESSYSGDEGIMLFELSSKRPQTLSKPLLLQKKSSALKQKQSCVFGRLPQEALTSRDDAIAYLEDLAQEMNPPIAQDPLAEAFFMFDEELLGCEDTKDAHNNGTPLVAKGRDDDNKRHTSSIISCSMVTPSPLSFMTGKERDPTPKPESADASSRYPSSSSITIIRPGYTPSQPIAINGSGSHTPRHDAIKEMQDDFKHSKRSPSLSKGSTSTPSVSSVKSTGKTPKMSQPMTIGSPALYGGVSSLKTPLRNTPPSHPIFEATQETPPLSFPKDKQRLTKGSTHRSSQQNKADEIF